MTNQKQTITYTYNPAAYKAFANFTTAKDLNTAFEMWLADHKKEFGRKELQALKTIVRHSVKVPGIATLKLKTVVKVAKEEFDFSFDLRTAKRAVAKAKNLGMLVTLETRTAKTNLKGPSIYVWQPYQCKNVPTEKVGTNIEKIAQECEELKRSKQSDEVAQSPNANMEMSPHKSVFIKAIKNKLLNTYSYGFKTISKSIAIKQERKITLLTQPVKNPTDFKPLKFISRLKQVMYNSLMNRRSDVKAVTEMIYSKVHSFTKFDVWKEHKDIMLEHLLRVVEVCLDARKNKKLDHIKSMRGFINHCLNEELNAYVFNEIEKLTPAPDKKVSQEIINLYQNESHKPNTFYEQELEKYYR